MAKKKLVAIILAAAIISSSGIVMAKKTFSSENKDNITVMDYKPAKEVNISNYQINRYEGIDAVGELNNNEVLTLNVKNDSSQSTKQLTGEYLSIYNLKSKKTTKEFKETNVDNFIGISPSKKFALYEEPKYISPNKEEYDAQVSSGEIYHHSIKIVNLNNGEITTLNTEYNNKDAEYEWISDSKILVNYHNHWSIIDASGKVYAEASYEGKIHDAGWISSVEVKDLGDSVEGKIYYTQQILDDSFKPVCIKLFSMNVKTKEKSVLFENTKISIQTQKKGNTIIMDKYIDNKEISPGYFDRSFEALILNEKGETVKEVKMPKPENPIGFALSPDGSKAAYVELNNTKSSAKDTTLKNGFDNTKSPTETTTLENAQVILSSNQNSLPDNTLKIIDTKTGEIKEILSCKGAQNLYWDSTGTKLYLNSGSQFSTNDKISTIVVDFDN